jgi:NAD(P)H dehydrogenase (quinone)
MTVLVLYHSRTGKTRRLAEEVARGVESVAGATSLVRSVADVTRREFADADAVIAGSPVYFGTMAAELKEVLDRFYGTRRKMQNKVGAAFATSGHHTGGKETTMLSIIQAFLIYGMIVVGDPLSAGGHYGVATSGEVDDEVGENGARLGARVASVAAALGGQQLQVD